MVNSLEPQLYLGRILTTPGFTVLPGRSLSVNDAIASTPNAALASVQSAMERANVPLPGSNTIGSGQISLGGLALIVIVLALLGYWLRGHIA